MMSSITWVDECSGDIYKTSISIGFAWLDITIQGDVVIGSHWNTDSNNAIESQSDVDILQYLKAPYLPKNGIRLLKQGSEYRQSVWKEILNIPFASTQTYTQLANSLNSGARAVAGACRDNPYPGIVPCHRVLARQGIGGFMGQTEGACVVLKKQLLDYEANRVEQ